MCNNKKTRAEGLWSPSARVGVHGSDRRLAVPPARGSRGRHGLNMRSRCRSTSWHGPPLGPRVIPCGLRVGLHSRQAESFSITHMASLTWRSAHGRSHCTPPLCGPGPPRWSSHGPCPPRRRVAMPPYVVAYRLAPGRSAAGRHGNSGRANWSGWPIGGGVEAVSVCRGRRRGVIAEWGQFRGA